MSTIVVSDATPLNYLALIGEIDLLPRLFKSVLVPPANSLVYLNQSQGHGSR
jgi:predicted nucleic acid-binding protein